MIATYPRFSHSERDRRWAAVHFLLERDDLDCLLVVRCGTHGVEPNLRYLAGSALHGATAVAFCLPQQARGPLLIAQSADLTEIDPGWCRDLQTVPDARWQTEVADALRGVPLAYRRIGVASMRDQRAGRGLPHDLMVRLRAALPSVHWIDVTGPLRSLRLVKSSPELDLIKEAGRRVDEALGRMHASAAHAAPERAVWSALIGELAKYGGPPGRVRWAAGPRPVPISALGHAELQRGFLCSAELEGSVAGYHGRASQTIAIEDCDPLIKELHALQAELWHEALRCLQLGERLAHVKRAFDSLAARFIPKEGHLATASPTLEMRGLGLGGDGPWLRGGRLDPEAANRTLAPGWAFSFSPGLTLSTPRWRYTAAWADGIVLTEHGPARLGARPVGLATSRP